ncbi:unnamed protein product [Penicillium crustosum]
MHLKKMGSSERRNDKGRRKHARDNESVQTAIELQKVRFSGTFEFDDSNTLYLAKITQSE